MADKRKGRPAPGSRVSAAEAKAVDDAERSLGRWVAVGLPAASVVAAAVVGIAASLGSALLVLAAGALLGAIALLWASVRTLSGDAPLPVDLEILAARGHAVDTLADRKRRVLGALKDLEREHDLGKIDDGDFETFVTRYRDDAKEIMREMDLRVAPMREEAERMVRESLKGAGLLPQAKAASLSSPSTPSAEGDRAVCAPCGTSNESDAAFCKSCGASMKHARAR